MFYTQHEFCFQLIKVTGTELSENCSSFAFLYKDTNVSDGFVFLLWFPFTQYCLFSFSPF